MSDPDTGLTPPLPGLVPLPLIPSTFTPPPAPPLPLSPASPPWPTTAINLAFSYKKMAEFSANPIIVYSTSFLMFTLIFDVPPCPPT